MVIAARPVLDLSRSASERANAQQFRFRNADCTLNKFEIDEPRHDRKNEFGKKKRRRKKKLEKCEKGDLYFFHIL